MPRATKHRLVIPIRKRCKRCECPPTAGTSEKRRPTPVRGDSLQHSAAERRRPWRGIDAEHARVAAGANCRRRGLLDAAVCRDAVHHDHRKPRSGAGHRRRAVPLLMSVCNRLVRSAERSDGPPAAPGSQLAATLLTLRARNEPGRSCRSNSSRRATSASSPPDRSVTAVAHPGPVPGQQRAAAASPRKRPSGACQQHQEHAAAQPTRYLHDEAQLAVGDPAPTPSAPIRGLPDRPPRPGHRGFAPGSVAMWPRQIQPAAMPSTEMAP